MAGPMDERELLGRALSLVPKEQRGYYRSVRSLVVSIASARQPILRPTEIERPAFHEELLQTILFGPQRLFTPSRPTTASVVDHALVLTHDEMDSVRLDGEGNLLMQLPLSPASHGMVIIEENVTSVLTAGLRYALWLLDFWIDPTQRLTHVALAATLSESDTAVWRTQREQDANPNSYSMGMGREGHQPVHLAPAHRPRPALRRNADQLVEDLVTLLRREWQSK
jgi:hypothetical protein